MSSSQHAAIIEKCRAVISAEHGVGLSSVCLLEPRTVEKTTSGKIARAWCRRGFVNGTLKIVSRWDGRPNEDLAVSSAEGSGDTTGVIGTQDVDSRVGKVVPMDLSSEPTLSAEEVRSLPVSEITVRLERALVLVSAQGPCPLASPLDTNASLQAMGLDSLTIVQFKGVLEKR